MWSWAAKDITDHSLMDIWHAQHPDNSTTFTFLKVEEHQACYSQLDRIYISMIHTVQVHSFSIQLTAFRDHHRAYDWVIRLYFVDLPAFHLSPVNHWGSRLMASAWSPQHRCISEVLYRISDSWFPCPFKLLDPLFSYSIKFEEDTVFNITNMVEQKNDTV